MTKSAQNGDQTWLETSKLDELHFERMKARRLEPRPEGLRPGGPVSGAKMISLQRGVHSLIVVACVALPSALSSWNLIFFRAANLFGVRFVFHYFHSIHPLK